MRSKQNIVLLPIDGGIRPRVFRVKLRYIISILGYDELFGVPEIASCWIYSSKIRELLCQIAVITVSTPLLGYCVFFIPAYYSMMMHVDVLMSR